MDWEGQFKESENEDKKVSPISASAAQTSAPQQTFTQKDPAMKQDGVKVMAVHIAIMK